MFVWVWASSLPSDDVEVETCQSCIHTCFGFYCNFIFFNKFDILPQEETVEKIHTEKKTRMHTHVERKRDCWRVRLLHHRKRETNIHKYTRASDGQRISHRIESCFSYTVHMCIRCDLKKPNKTRTLKILPLYIGVVTATTLANSSSRSTKKRKEYKKYNYYTLSRTRKTEREKDEYRLNTIVSKF